MDAPPITRALSFGRGAASYDRVRPDYSPEAIDLVAGKLGLGRDSDVLDLGAGTGKLTRPLVERFGRVTAVEPDEGMRALLTRGTYAYRVLGGTAEAIPLGDRAVHAVFVGQAFHWFSTGEALAEIARVLRPAGGLVLIWNSWSDTEPPLPQAANALMQGVLERARLQPIDLDKDDWQSCFDPSPFEALREESVPTRTLDVDAERLVSLYLSTSPFGVLPADELAAAGAELRRLITGTYRLPVGTELYWTRLSK